MYTPQKVRQIAEGFIAGSKRCKEVRKNFDGTIESPIIAGVVLEALSIELLLKSILLEECGSPVRGHEFKVLYKKLSDDSKKFLQQSLGLEKNILETQINEVSNAFIEWRYIFESDSTSLNIDFLDSLLSSIKKLAEKKC